MYAAVYTFEKSIITLPLHDNTFVSAYEGILVIGYALNGTYVQAFEFQSCDIAALYKSLILCAQFFADDKSSQLKTTFLNQKDFVYYLTSKELFHDTEKERIVVYGKEQITNSQVSGNIENFTLNLNCSNFNTFIQALSICIWHCLCIKQKYLIVFKEISKLPMDTIMTLLNENNFTNHIQNTFKTYNDDILLLNQIFEFHFEKIVILKRLHSLVNKKQITKNIKDLL